jgi:hypothetical protein
MPTIAGTHKTEDQEQTGVDNRRDVSIIMKTIKSRTRGDPNSSKYIDNSRVHSSTSRVDSSSRDNGIISNIIRDTSNKGE